MMDFTTAIGLAAGTLTTIAFIPQVTKIWRTRSTKDLSLGMFLVLCCGIILWLIYGILTEDIPVLVANGATLCLAATILFFKLKYK